MNQADNKLLASLLQRLQELDQENKALKEQLVKQTVKGVMTNNPQSAPYFKIKELILANSEEQQICSLCDCDLDNQSTINLIKIYFCDNNCSLLMERTIEAALEILRKK